ncbi:NACHT domain-containing protein [Flavobacterium sp. CF136]|uniref:NACHT domain-containing protein n=1 Tax=Flavobacterium sp. (strain CF136) TaxID=1144313 RepID=UPI000271D2A4|nr:NACHT domain-containing protein [Flavobacterium sp. CF136]EJL59480.1 putative NTPase (NACHT family) [Flavobacterium sp. CF136]
MKKKQIESIVKIIPDFFKNATDYLKNNFTENAQELINNSNGTISLIVKLFAQPLIDKYFQNIDEKKLENFGYETYLKSAILQASSSIESIKESIPSNLSPNIIFSIIENSIKEETIGYFQENIIHIFQPKYHPAIIFVKGHYLRILKEIKVESEYCELFIKHFNDNIEKKVIQEFGDAYNEHIQRTEEYRLKENEVQFLLKTIKASKIGLKESENLKYEDTYAEWKKVSEIRDIEEELFFETDDEYDEYESQLKPIEDLIENYFGKNPESHLDKILFLIADFGKGKSVFMRHYASQMATNYLKTSEGPFPIYFNLRNYSKYSNETNLGIISDYLESDFSIKIDDDYFQRKKYVFLIDSLDESGDLNKKSIDKVINSIKRIQRLDKIKYRTNRIIITSRPFDEGLTHHLTEHTPFIRKNSEQRDVPCFLSIYGFTKIQFNDWLFNTLSSLTNIDENTTTGFAKEIIDSIKQQQKKDIYSELLKNKTLSKSELRRPIFAYMIHQLIINNVDFLAIGKLGVYLSFLNLLTKEAKHIHDSNYTVNLTEELEFRNILHATSSLWMYERMKGKQGMLKKADICRVLEGKFISTNDNDVLESFKNNGFTEIQFLSHSYFGEDNNVLHFQHQSFAEILLAEYYLKIFLKYSLDEDADIEEARTKLAIGEPTEQTILFFKELLELLREASTNKTNSQVLEKRKLLFPLMASLSIRKHNRVFSNTLHYSWFQKYKIDENQTEYPAGLLNEWCINEEKVTRIISFAANIINSKTYYLPIQGKPKTALFDLEILEVQNQNVPTSIQNIDKWLALIVGNYLYNDLNSKKKKIFNFDNKINFNHLFELIRSWNYAYNHSSPFWGKELFIGINMNDNLSQLELSHYDFDGIDFSHSYLKNIRSWAANWSRTKLNSCSFQNVDFITSLFLVSSIRDIRMIDNLTIMNCQASTTGLSILECFQTRDLISKKSNFRPHNMSAFIPNQTSIHSLNDIWNTIEGFMIYGLQNSFFTIIGLKKLFIIENPEFEKEFIKKIDELKNHQIKKLNPHQKKI